MAYSLSDHFSSMQLLRYAFPSIVSMTFTSMYTIVDGIFVSNVVGANAFASLNLIWPVIGIIQSVGLMFGAGGSALIARTLGEQRPKLANDYFSMLVCFEFLLGIVISGSTLLVLRPIAAALGASELLMEDCLIYGGILLVMMPFVYLCSSFQSFLLVAARPKMGLCINLGGGLLNIVLDYVLMVPCRMGIAGAALATGLNWMITGLLPLIYFLNKNSSDLRLGRFTWHWKALRRAMLNGSSEMVTSASVNLIAVLYNLALMQYIGPGGVIAFGVIQYTQILFLALFFGYNMASAPLIGYQYGAQNHRELHSLLSKSLGICMAACVSLTILAEWSAPWLSMVFVSYSQPLMELTTHAIRLFSWCYLVTGINVFIGSFFTALSNGLVSAILSFLRTFLFQAGCVLLLPLWWGMNGIWWATTVSELMALALSLYFLFRLEPRYHYGPLGPVSRSQAAS